MSGKKTTIVSIIALILGASGLGYGLFSGVTMQSIIYTKSGVQKTWFISDATDYSKSSTPLALLGTMNLTVQVNAGESLHANFQGNVRISTSTQSIGFTIYIDGAETDYAYCFNEDYISISLQILEKGLTPGAHTILVMWGLSGAATAYCTASSLLVHTLIE